MTISSDSIISWVVGGFMTFGVAYLSTIQLRRHSKDLRDMIGKITGLFAASQMVGIDTAYENREVALLERDAHGKAAESFLTHIKREGKLIVVGSSLLGLRMYVQRLAQYLRAREEKGLETKLLLTHPCFSMLRENQEKRSSGQIHNEIEDTLRFLKQDCGLVLESSVRFYKGTPTCFMILTSNAMLLNPYPYQAEAFKAFCLEVRRLDRTDSTSFKMAKEKKDVLEVIDKLRFGDEVQKIIDDPEWKIYNYSEDVGPDIYGQFYWYHYFLPWFSRQVVTYAEYDTICRKCEFLHVGFSKTCPLDQRSCGVPSEGPPST